MTNIAPIQPELTSSISLLYKPMQWEISEIQMEKESANYGACIFKINNLNVLFRVAKVTPTKPGLFVTLWKRPCAKLPIVPYGISDRIDFYVISACSGRNFGQFIFPQSILLQQKIMSDDKQIGKLGIRVYPPSELKLNASAQRTQKWQKQYFLAMDEGQGIDFINASSLYLLK